MYLDPTVRVAGIGVSKSYHHELENRDHYIDFNFSFGFSIYGLPPTEPRQRFWKVRWVLKQLKEYATLLSLVAQITSEILKHLRASDAPHIQAVEMNETGRLFVNGFQRDNSAIESQHSFDIIRLPVGDCHILTCPHSAA